MAKDEISGAELLVAILERLGVKTVFGVPGTQNVSVFDALSHSSVRTILASQETAASFMANGYARTCGAPGIVITIPGPGLLFAVPGLMEARHDSAPLLCLCVGGEHHSKHQFRLHHMEAGAILKPICKQGFHVNRAEKLPQVIHEAYHLALRGEPGPVFIEVSSACLGGSVRASLANANIPPQAVAHAEAKSVIDVARRICEAQKPLLFIGQGCVEASSELETLATVLDCPVVCTCSARGVVRDSHPLALVYDFGDGGGKTLNELFRESDCVLALGCKFSHNGSAGFQLQISPEKLIHVDASRETLGANYAASLLLETDVPAFLRDLFETTLFQSLLQRISTESRPAIGEPKRGWSVAELSDFRDRLKQEQEQRLVFPPDLVDVPGKNIRQFYDVLNAALPEGSIVVTDSGHHQRLTRCFARVESSRGLLVPSDFQSMGFGLPAAIGAKLAAPEREVVLIVGDGGLAATGLELLTAVREQIPLTVVVFSDGYLNAIRHIQLADFGRESSVAIRNPDFQRLAESLGATYARYAGDAAAFEAPEDSRVHLVELRLADPESLRAATRSRFLKEQVRSLVGDRVIRTMKGLLGR